MFVQFVHARRTQASLFMATAEDCFSNVPQEGVLSCGVLHVLERPVVTS